MKKIITVIAVVVAGAAFAATSRTIAAIPGTDNVSVGYGSGNGSSGTSQDVIALGTNAGADSKGNNRCTFIGKNAGLGATNCTDCTFIGKESGKGLSGYSNCIKIGDAIECFASTTRVSTVYADGLVAENIYLNEGKALKLAVNEGTADTFCIYSTNNLHSYGTVDGSQFVTEKMLDYMKLKFVDDELHVYSNGVSVGTLTFTPAQ